MHSTLRKYTVLAFLILNFSTSSVFAETLAYWRFEQGPANSNLPTGFSVVDESGNGNHLSPWTAGGSSGYIYNSNVADSIVRATGQTNNYSVINTGSTPSMVTRSTNKSYGSGSYPTGIDIETAQLREFTVEIIFKAEKGGYRTLIGRDARYVGEDSSLAAFYLQLTNDNNISAVMSDVTGMTHRATSPEQMVTCFDKDSDPEGVNGRWYYAAAVSDGNTLQLFLSNLTAGSDAHRVAEVDLTESSDPTMAIGTTSGGSWHAGGWSVGRGLYGGNKTDYTPGYIDEVRISNKALSISEFLIMPKAAADVNPIFDAADPSILLEGTRAYIYPTSGYYRYTYVYYSLDMVNWYQRGPILNFDKISWIPSGKNCWAPGIIKKNNKYYLYYSAGPKPSYIGVAVANSPTSNFTDSGQALIADNGDSSFEAIDPMAFEDPISGKTYLYFGGSAGSKLKVYELNEDMVSLGNEIYVDNPTNFTEGAFMHYRKGTYYLTYSHGSWNRSSYSLHYCTSSSPIGPWKYRGEILKTDGWFKGPGHHSIMYNGATDQWYVCYHRWNERAGDGPYSGSRSTCIDMLYYDENGLIKPIIQTDKGVGPVRIGESFLGDFNSDDTVDIADMDYFADHWLSNDYAADIAPVRHDYKVNMLDFAEFTSNYWLVTPEK